MPGVLCDTRQHKQNPRLQALVRLRTLSKKQAGEAVCSPAKRASPEAGLPQVRLRTENVCLGVCKHTPALTQVPRLNVCYLQGQTPRPGISLKYCQVGNVLWYLQNYSQEEDPLNPGPLGHVQSPSAT